MSQGFYVAVKDMQRIEHADQPIGRLQVPAGQYLIFGKANVAGLKLNETTPFPQALEAKLLAGGQEDKLLLSLNTNGDGGNWGTIALNIAVTLDAAGTINMTCTAGIPGDILIFEVAISAIQVDQLQAGISGPPAIERKNQFSSLISRASKFRLADFANK
ncbi:hypothetical protein [Flavihumibacter fluvii]|uniref:hypothetical protein n=1 Tax=Flavihumibacter fluvii TaxID=2838157 RepID=UPI001BDEBCE5|nr:hypothetical protein [Flavihumibacter fluvii]ULQ52124.1 hypothetical protein KJS93_18690 [Flavihumibacter fluvii]